MKVEHLLFLDSVSFLPCPLSKLPEAYGPTASKSWYPHYYNTKENFDYIGPIHEVTYYGVNEMGEEERNEFLAWYKSHNSEHFDKRRVLLKYSQDDVTVLRQAFRGFRREFMQIGSIDYFPSR